MPKELDVDYNLINKDFFSYRLKENVPWNIESNSFDENYGQLQILELIQSEYSYLHLSMAAKINNLKYDYCYPQNVYFITANGHVVRCRFENETSSFSSCMHIPDYNVQTAYSSMAFVSKSIVLVLVSTRQKSKDFSSKILIIDRTVESSSGEEVWKLNDSFQLLTPTLFPSSEQASHMILFNSSTIRIKTESTVISFVIGSIQKAEFKEENSKKNFQSPFHTGLHCLTLEQTIESKSWFLKNYQRFLENNISKSEWPKYLALHCFDNCDYLIVVSEGRMKFSRIIENGVIIESSSEQELQVLKTVDDDLKEKKLETIIDEEKEENDIDNFHSQKIVEDFEECDHQDSRSLTSVMSVFDSQTGQIIEEYDLGSQQWLFDLPNLSNNQLPPMFAVRHDVDAFVYDLKPKNNFIAQHIATIDAFGYIQASKTNKLFMTMFMFQEKFPFALIANSEKDLFVYWRSTCQPNQNGVSDKSNLMFGHQSMVCLEPFNQSIHGLHHCRSPSSRDLVFVLTKNHIHLMKFID